MEITNKSSESHSEDHESKKDDKIKFENEENFVEVKTGRCLKTNYYNDYDLKAIYTDISLSQYYIKRFVYYLRK